MATTSAHIVKKTQQISTSMAKSVVCVFGGMRRFVASIVALAKGWFAELRSPSATHTPETFSENSCVDEPSIATNESYAILDELGKVYKQRVSHIRLIAESFSAKYRLTVGARHNLSIGDGI